MTAAQYRPIQREEFIQLIELDKTCFLELMQNAHLPKQQIPPEWTIADIEKAYKNKDILQWIIVNNDIAGYFWFELQSDALYVAGVAIKSPFQGKGLIQPVLQLAETLALKHHLEKCRLAVAPLNGRALSAYFKAGFKIIKCVEAFFGKDYPDSFRLIMEKNLIINHDRPIEDQYTVLCSDNKKLLYATEQEYVGIKILPDALGENLNNQILFVKYQKKGAE